MTTTTLLLLIAGVVASAALETDRFFIPTAELVDELLAAAPLRAYRHPAIPHSPFRQRPFFRAQPKRYFDSLAGQSLGKRAQLGAAAATSAEEFDGPSDLRWRNQLRPGWQFWRRR